MPSRLAHAFRLIIRRAEGASSVEYGLLVAAIATVIIAAAFGLGGVTQGLFGKTASCVSTSGTSGC